MKTGNAKGRRLDLGPAPSHSAAVGLSASLGCRAQLVVKVVIIPFLLYFGSFLTLTYPLITRFSTHFFADAGDGLKSVWGIWWVSKAVTGLHQSPLHTSYLYHPMGVSLVGLFYLFPGLLGPFLLRFLTLVQTYNLIIIYTFVIGGLAGFWLSYRISHSYSGSLIAGFIFSFSNFHFARAEGHLGLMSIEWMPLFALSWYALLSRPRIGLAVASALALFAAALCNYYYLGYCLVLALVILAWHSIQRRRLLFFLGRDYLAPLGLFLLTFAATTGPLVALFMAVNLRDPLMGGGHDVEALSLDLLAPIIPGGHWRFADLTRCYWSKLPGNIQESSVHLGLSVFFLLAYVWVRRRTLQVESLLLWYFVFGLSILLSLGPVLHVWGMRVSSFPLPYALLSDLLFPSKSWGSPLRMMVLATLAASVVSAVGFKGLFGGSARERLLGIAVLLLLIVEYLPKPIPSTRISPPGYVSLLRSLPDANDAVLDAVDRPALACYYQTIHERPLAFGRGMDCDFLALTPKSAALADGQILLLLRDHKYLTLWRTYRIRYLVAGSALPPGSDSVSPKVLWRGGDVALYDLAGDSAAHWPPGPKAVPPALEATRVAVRLTDGEVLRQSWWGYVAADGSPVSGAGNTRAAMRVEQVAAGGIVGSAITMLPPNQTGQTFAAFVVDLPPGAAALHFQIATPENQSPGGGTSYAVRVISGPLGDRLIWATRYGKPEWTDVVVDLGPYAGWKVTLRLMNGWDDRSGAYAGRACWGEPEILGPEEDAATPLRD